MNIQKTSSLAVTLGIMLAGCWVGGGDNPGGTFELNVESVSAERADDDAVAVELVVACSATDYEVLTDPSTASPGDCPASEWCMTARWFPRSALSATPSRESDGELGFDIPRDEVELTGDPVSSVEACQIDEEDPMDGSSLVVSAMSDGSITEPDLVIDVVLSRRQADTPGNSVQHHRAILVSPGG